MQSNAENNIIVAKFEANEDVLSNLNLLVEKYSIKTGFIDMGIGMIKFKMGYDINYLYNSNYAYYYIHFYQVFNPLIFHAFSI